MHCCRPCTSVLAAWLISLLVLVCFKPALSRQLQLSAPPGCNGRLPGCAVPCQPTIVGTRSILTCPHCADRWYARSDDGTRCDCRPGTYANCSIGPCACLPCPVGSYCPGGLNTDAPRTGIVSATVAVHESTTAVGAALQWAATLPPAIAVPCGPGRTTRAGQTARVRNQCVLLPGYGWQSKTADAPTLCPVGSYSTGWRSALTPCTRCPSGLTTRRQGAVLKDECVVAPGLYLSEGVVKPCPAGTYQPDFHLQQGISVCRPCAAGVTTANSAAGAATECALAQPGYGITTCDSSRGCQAQLCGQGYFSEGGLFGSNSCKPCPWGLTTQHAGSPADSLCLVPPGFGLVYPLPASTADNAVQPCTAGYNPGWNRQPCTPCGVNITSRNNRTSAFDCFVLKGQGLQILPASASGTTPVRGALDCWPGSIGMAQDTLMFNARPCDTCPRYMTTEQSLASNRSMDCKAQPGYTQVIGADPIAAVPCAVGSYKPTLSNAECTPCPNNTSTLGVGSIAVSNCTVCQQGFGGWSAQGPSCDVRCTNGTYNNGSYANCSPCPVGFVPTQNLTGCQPQAPTVSPGPSPSPSPAPSPSPLPPQSCQGRPNTSWAGAPAMPCPTNSWDFIPPGNHYSLPPSCKPPSGKCDTALGQQVDRGDLTEVTVNGQTSCMCVEALTKGYVLKPVGGKYKCMPGASFIPLNDSNPMGAGIWVPLASGCTDAQSCWDMCFFCDGTRRYANSTTGAAGVTGTRIHRRILNSLLCSLISCPLTSPQPADTLTFREACDRYAANSAPWRQCDLQLLDNLYWPFRPQQSAADQLVLARPITTFLCRLLTTLVNLVTSVDQGQEVMQSWSW